MMETKACSSCEKEKPILAFYKSPHKKGTTRSTCKECDKASKKARYSPHKTRDINLRFLYGITTDEYNTLLEEQGYRCAICAEEPKEGERPLFVDHVHISGKVRGLLCAQCNFGLGHFKDNMQLLQNAIDYLSAVAGGPAGVPLKGEVLGNDGS
jgi:hypothetical protein